MDITAINGGGGAGGIRRLSANAILNFHFFNPTLNFNNSHINPMATALDQEKSLSSLTSVSRSTFLFRLPVWFSLRAHCDCNHRHSWHPGGAPHHRGLSHHHQQPHLWHQTITITTSQHHSRHPNSLLSAASPPTFGSSFTLLSTRGHFTRSSQDLRYFVWLKSTR